MRLDGLAVDPLNVLLLRILRDRMTVASPILLISSWYIFLTDNKTTRAVLRVCLLKKEKAQVALPFAILDF